MKKLLVSLLLFISFSASSQSDVLIIYNSSWGNNGTFNCVQDYAGGNGNFTLCPMPTGSGIAPPACMVALNTYDMVMVQATYSDVNAAFIALLVTYIQGGGSVYFQNDCSGIPTLPQQNINDLLNACGQPNITLTCGGANYTEIPVLGGVGASNYTCPLTTVSYNSGGWLSGPGLTTATTGSLINGTPWAFWPTGFGGTLGIGTEFYSSGNWAGTCLIGAGQIVWDFMIGSNPCDIVAEFSIPNDTICVGDCIDITDLSTPPSGATITSWDYQIAGGTPATSSSQNPTNICFNTVGNYNIVLTVTDDQAHVDDTTIAIVVESCVSIEASFSVNQSICEGDCVTFTDLSTSNGNLTNWDWTFSNGTPATANGQDPGSICFNTAGVHPVTLTVTDDMAGTDDTTINITVSPVYNLAENVTACENDSYTYPDGTSAVITANTSYTSNLLSSFNCDSVIVTNVTMNPIQNSTENFTICSGDDYTYPDGTVHTNITANESYVSTIAAISGCDSLVTTNLSITAGSSPTWTTITLCQSDAPIDLTGQITGDLGGTWSGTGMTGSIFDPSSGTQSITYTVGAGGCTSTSTQTITVVDPQPTVTGTNISCFGLTDGSANVSVVGGSGNYTYSWDSTPVQTTATATNLPAGTYTVTVTDVDGGCSVTSSITIIEPAELTAILNAVSGCLPNLGAASASTSGGTGPYTYVWNNSPSIIETATNLDSAMHTVVITDASGCTYTDSILVQLFPSPIATVNADTTIIYGNPLLLSGGGGTSYLWSPDYEMDCDTCQSPYVNPQETTIYCLEVTDNNGCTNSACVLVTVEIICGEVFVPSAFSPNGDGENDLECVYSDCMESFTFTIYNRWGEKVFETSNTNICWDGTWKGKELNSAVFVYILEGYLINGVKVSQKGNVSLIR